MAWHVRYRRDDSLPADQEQAPMQVAEAFNFRLRADGG